MNNQNPPKQYGLKYVFGIGIILLIFAALLLADLIFHGLAWNFIYYQTGEESIMGQLQGMVELGGNLFRAQPQTDPYTPIQHNDIFPYGINTFLEQETEEAKLRVMLQMIHEAGFGWIRQEFPWADIEVDGRGQFTDSREDVTGDGIIDTISSWQKYDRIVDLAEENDLGMIVRLSTPPNWSRAENYDTPAGIKAPPDDYQDFVNYAVAVAEHYRGRIRYYQVWNEPNIYPEWGEDFVNPADYTRLLCMTYEALKAVDPQIVVISGTIAPTNSLDGYYGYHDLVFLQNLYDNGAGECFDVLSAQGYGLNSSPYDRRESAVHLSFSRHIAYRDIMLRNGDAHKPIWLSEVAWNPILDAWRPIEEIAGAYNYGAVTNEQAAAYLPQAFDRANQEWPWVGQLSYWHFTRFTIDESQTNWYWFRMVEADYSPESGTFTPLPIYYAAQSYLQGIRQHPVMYLGVHQAESWEVFFPDSAQRLVNESAQFGEAMSTPRLEFIANGTEIRLRVQNDNPIRVSLDGSEVTTIAPSAEWQELVIWGAFLPEEHTVTLESDAAFWADNITVRDDTQGHILPIIAIVGIALLAGIVLLWRRLKA
jgi:polysaccharide biosynthesis protein PslG